MSIFRCLLGMAIAAAIAGCAPGDKHSYTVKERLEKGELVEFTEPGYLRAGCGAAWSDIRLANDAERARVVSRRQMSAMFTGRRQCQMVGETVVLGMGRNSRAEFGKVQLVKIGLIKAPFLKANTRGAVEGRFFAQDTDFYAYKDNIVKNLRPEDEEILTILTFRYVEGSAMDEVALRAVDESNSTRPNPPVMVDNYAETSLPGQTVSACRSNWTDFAVAPEFQNAIASGTLNSWYRIGDQNCLAHGSEIALNTKRGEPGFLNVQVARVKMLPSGMVNAGHFSLNGLDYESLRPKIEADIAAADPKYSGWITIVDFVPRQVTPMNEEGADRE